ncbi:helix-turn-helix domain-containing protein [Ottowia sp. VDI28]|uniref:helix-turn-helix domain-containing protein n=1 Tax=Ottowia sp. VDI28 TaxID=3133968 RepID=UPI003C2D9952
MHPEQIKAEIRMRGTTPAAIADSLHLSRQTVSNVIHSRVTSRKVANAISAIIGKPVGRIWPGHYEPAKANGLKRRGK